MHAAPRLVVFDCDGTLVDSHHAIVRNVQRAFARQGLPVPSANAVRERVGLSLSAFVEDLIGGLPPDRVDALITSYREEHVAAQERDGRDHLFDGIGDLLDRLLDRGVLLGVATGKSRRGLLSVIEEHDLQRHFVTLQTADDAPSKPHPGMILRAMDEAGVPAEATVVVGDSIHDVGAALSAGTEAVGVGWGSHDPDRLLTAGARVVVADVPTLGRELGVVDSDPVV
ncbi:MAG TPA: HAD-IA family hydrolase [Candidatus Krumholzibacteria bacterium]|nr:HAD-IA family hydrolase [Candidatus Krumholzibacteria bacterium]